jgi:hypothetical protein
MMLPHLNILISANGRKLQSPIPKDVELSSSALMTRDFQDGLTKTKKWVRMSVSESTVESVDSEFGFLVKEP